MIMHPARKLSGLILLAGLSAAPAYGQDLPLYPSFPGEGFPEGPDFPPMPDLGEFPGVPSIPGGMVCFSIHEPTGATFTGEGRKWTAVARALDACENWKVLNDVEGLGSCRILNCETLIDVY